MVPSTKLAQKPMYRSIQHNKHMFNDVTRKSAKSHLENPVGKKNKNKIGKLVSSDAINGVLMKLPESSWDDTRRGRHRFFIISRSVPCQLNYFYAQRNCGKIAGGRQNVLC